MQRKLKYFFYIRAKPVTKAAKNAAIKMELFEVQDILYFFPNNKNIVTFQ